MSFALPSTLSPSKLSKFMSCPLAFRFSYIERLPEPASPHLVRGTLVHKALQLLLSTWEPGERTRARALATLDAAWTLLEDGDIASLALDDAGKAALRAEAAALVERYFLIEDPTSVEPIGIELELRARAGDVELHGIIDRLDRRPNGDLVVIDYKTGRAPRPEHARARMVGVQFYAFLCEQVLGQLPKEIRLLYLRDPAVIIESPSAQSMRGLRQRAVAVWQAIERACVQEDFRPHPSPLCKGCAFRSYCPAFGGLPERARQLLEERVPVGVGAASE